MEARPQLARAALRRVPPLRFWMLAVYVALILAPNNIYLPDRFRVLLVNYRPFAIVAILAWILVDALRDPGSVRRYTRRARFIRPAIIGLAFPVFYVLIAVLKPELRFTSALLYGLWAITAFIAWPLFARTRSEQATWLRMLLVANLAAWIIPMVYSLFGPTVELVFTRIESFGYLNPDYFAQALQSVFAIALLAQPRKRGWVVTRYLCLAITALLIWSLVARNVLVFIAVLTVAMPVLRSTRRPGLAVSTLLGVSLMVALLGSQFFERTDIDDFSSGRIDTWQERIEQSFSRGDDAKTFLIGPDELPRDRRPRSGYDPLREAKTYGKFHTDNAFLELFFEAGILGLLLFVFPYLLVVMWTLRRIRMTRDQADIWAVGVLVAISCQSMFTGSVPTFASPLAFLFLTALGLAFGPVRRE